MKVLFSLIAKATNVCILSSQINTEIHQGQNCTMIAQNCSIHTLMHSDQACRFMRRACRPIPIKLQYPHTTHSCLCISSASAHDQFHTTTITRHVLIAARNRSQLTKQRLGRRQICSIEVDKNLTTIVLTLRKQTEEYLTFLNHLTKNNNINGSQHRPSEH